MIYFIAHLAHCCLLGEGLKDLVLSDIPAILTSDSTPSPISCNFLGKNLVECCTLVSGE